MVLKFDVYSFDGGDEVWLESICDVNFFGYGVDVFEVFEGFGDKILFGKVFEFRFGRGLGIGDDGVMKEDGCGVVEGLEVVFLDEVCNVVWYVFEFWLVVVGMVCEGCWVVEGVEDIGFEGIDGGCFVCWLRVVFWEGGF